MKIPLLVVSAVLALQCRPSHCSNVTTETYSALNATSGNATELGVRSGFSLDDEDGSSNDGVSSALIEERRRGYLHRPSTSFGQTNPFNNQNNPFINQNSPFNNQNNPFNNQNNPFNSQNTQNINQNNPYTNQNTQNNNHNSHHNNQNHHQNSHHHNQNNSQNTKRMKVEYAWRTVDFLYPSDRARQEAIQSGDYDPKKIITLDVDVWFKEGRRKVFVTMPRDTGVPASLATVSDAANPRGEGRLLAPYPDWSWHRRGDCDAISSVYRVAVDEVDRLWVLDRGDGARCTPQILVFDLKTDALQTRFRIPTNVLKPKHNLITPVVDVRDGGRNTFVYIADVLGHCLIVYDHQRRRAWRVDHPFFHPDPLYGTYNIAGTSFTLMDGVFGMALSPLRKGDRTLYFHALASVNENWVQASVLRDPNNFPNGTNRMASAFKRSDQTRASQSAAQAVTPEGVLFAGLLSELAITCWNPETPYAGWNLHVVVRDSETLQFTSGMKVRDGRLWVMTCRYQRFATNTMDWNDVNYRVLSARVEDLVHGTNCDVRKGNTIG